MIHFLSCRYEKIEDVERSHLKLTELALCSTPVGIKTWVVTPQAHSEIAKQVLDYLRDDPSPQFWGYYCASDWVMFMHLLRGVTIPPKFPIYCGELAQEIARLKLSLRDLPRTPSLGQDIIGDVEWCRSVYWYIQGGN